MNSEETKPILPTQIEEARKLIAEVEKEELELAGKEYEKFLSDWCSRYNCVLTYKPVLEDDRIKVLLAISRK